MNAAETGYPSAADLESAHRRAEAAHREHEKRTGRSHLLHRSSQNGDQPAWHAAYMVAEQAGTDLPDWRIPRLPRAAAAGATRPEGTGK